MELLPKGQVAYDASAALTLASQARALHEHADLQIDSDALLHIAAADLRQVKALLRDVDHQRTRIARPLQEALGAVNELFREPRTFLEQAEARLKAAILAYTELQREQFAAAQREAEAATRKAQAQLAAEAADQQARAQAALSRCETSRAAFEVAQQQGDVAAAENARVQLASDRAAAESAEAVARATAETAAVISLPVAAPVPSRPCGVSGRVTWTAQVDDLAALIEAVARQQAPCEAICANEKFLAAQARAFQREGVLYPGVRALARRSIAARSAPV